MPQALDYRGDFLAQLAYHALGVRIHAARHHEVLPYDYAVLVAPVVEVVALVHAAAPYAHRVAADVLDQVQYARYALAVVAMQRVRGYPVGALYVYAMAVDYEAELALAVCVQYVIALQFNRAQALPELDRIDRPTLLEQRHGYVVQIRLAVAARPPQLCVVHLKRHAPVYVPQRLFAFEPAVAAYALNAYRIEHGMLAPDVHVEYHCAGGLIALYARDHQIGAVDAQGALLHHAHRPPQSRGHYARAYVPAEHVRGLADYQRFVIVLLRGLERGDGVLARFQRRRVYMNQHLVQSVNQSLGLELVGDEHVFGIADLLAVQVYVRDRVYAFKVYKGVLGIGVPVEFDRIEYVLGLMQA